MTTNIPNNLKYTKEHEWVLVDGKTITVGITDFAQSSLGDIVFVEFPEVGKELKKDEAFGVVESIKSVSDLYSPLEGKVLEVNEALSDSPEAINENPYESWMIKLELSDESLLGELLSSDDYKSLCE